MQLGLGVPAWGNKRPRSPYLTTWNTHCICPRLHWLPGAVGGVFWWMGLPSLPGPALEGQKQTSCEVQKETSGQSELAELGRELCPTHPCLSTWCRSRPCSNSTPKSWPMSSTMTVLLNFSLNEPQPGGLGLSSCFFIQPMSACFQPGTHWAQRVYIVGCDPVTSTLRVPLSSPLSHSTAFGGKLIWKAPGPEFFTWLWQLWSCRSSWAGVPLLVTSTRCAKDAAPWTDLAPH